MNQLIRRRSAFCRVAGAIVVGILAMPASSAFAGGGNSIAIVPGDSTVASGVQFTVTAGGGNREFASVDVRCSAGGDEVYATILTVEVPPKGSGTSDLIYPPASSCVANLIKLMQIGKARVLATVAFEVSP